MADKNPSDNKPHDFEEEFDFDTNEIFENNSDQVQNTISSMPESSSFKEKAKWPFFIGIVILGFLAWKFYGVLFPSTAESRLDRIAAEEAAAIAANEHPVTQKIPAAPSAHVAAPLPVSPAPVPQVVVAPEPIAVLPAPALVPAQEELKQLEGTMNHVMDSLNKMDQKISLIGREFFALSDNVNRLSQEVADLKTKKNVEPIAPKRPVHPPRPHHRPIKKTEPVYSVESAEEAILEEPIKQHAPKTAQTHRKVDLVIHAIIPGRAWLKAPDGSIFTVTTGEMIPGYGKAMVIDAPSASVVTSSGVVLR